MPGGAQSNNGSQGKAPATLTKEEQALLEKLLGPKRTKQLATISERIGLSSVEQLTGAAAAWIEFNKWKDKWGDHHEKDELRRIPYVLNPEAYDYIVAVERQFWISPEGRQLYQDLVGQLRRMPIDAARAVASGLRDLLAYHPGFHDEFRALDEFINSIDGIGHSYAVEPPKRPVQQNLSKAAA